MACIEVFPDLEPMPCPTFEDAFAAVSSGEAALGMIPVENSIAGRVADIHHLMPNSGLHIVAEWFLPIRNQLMATKGATLKIYKGAPHGGSHRCRYDDRAGPRRRGPSHG